MPDARDWEIVEALASDGVGLEDFNPADVQRVSESRIWTFWDGATILSHIYWRF
jgi:hypothetical protein